MTHINLSAITVDPKFAGMDIRKDAIFFDRLVGSCNNNAFHCDLFDFGMDAVVSIYGMNDDDHCKEWKVVGIPSVEGATLPSLQHATEAALKAMGAW